MDGECAAAVGEEELRPVEGTEDAVHAVDALHERRELGRRRYVAPLAEHDRESQIAPAPHEAGGDAARGERAREQTTGQCDGERIARSDQLVERGGEEGVERLMLVEAYEIVQRPALHVEDPLEAWCPALAGDDGDERKPGERAADPDRVAWRLHVAMGSAICLVNFSSVVFQTASVNRWMRTRSKSGLKRFAASTSTRKAYSIVFVFTFVSRWMWR